MFTSLILRRIIRAGAEDRPTATQFGFREFRGMLMQFLLRVGVWT